MDDPITEDCWNVVVPMELIIAPPPHGSPQQEYETATGEQTDDGAGQAIGGGHVGVVGQTGDGGQHLVVGHVATGGHVVVTTGAGAGHGLQTTGVA